MVGMVALPLKQSSSGSGKVLMELMYAMGQLNLRMNSPQCGTSSGLMCRVICQARVRRPRVYQVTAVGHICSLGIA